MIQFVGELPEIGPIGVDETDLFLPLLPGDLTGEYNLSNRLV